LLANLHDYLGDGPRAWAHRVQALERLARSGSAQIRHGILLGVAGQALKEREPAAALPFQDAVLASALDSKRPAAVAEGLAQRASILAALGRAAPAASDLAAAREQLAAVPDGALRNRLQTVLLNAEVDVARLGSSAGAAAAAADAIRLIEERGETARLPRLYFRLGESLLASGRRADARVAIDAGIAAFERELNARPDAVHSHLDDAWKLFEVGLAIALDEGDLDRAFALGDLARSKDLRRNDPKTRGIRPADLQSRLAPDEAVVALNQLDRELIIWVVTQSRFRVTRRPLSQASAESLVLRQMDEIALQTPGPAAAGALFSEIVRPVGFELRGKRRVVVAADAPFFAASFPALWDVARRRFWVEDVELTVTSALSNRAAAEAGRTPPVLVDLPTTTTSDALVAAWAAAPVHAIVRVRALAAANESTPQLARLVLSDRPGSPYSGLVLMRDLNENLPPVRAVLLPNVDPGSQPTAGQGVYSVAAPLLETGSPHVVSVIAPLSPDPAFEEGFTRELLAGDSVVSTVTSFQRDVLRQTGRRLGAWSRLVVYGAGR
jgi:tetratricopeptide (TPR) repeat protein